MTGVVIHIGFESTGSAFLQRYLHDQSRPLADRGLVYSVPGRPTYPFTALNHEVLASLLLPAEQTPRDMLTAYVSHETARTIAEGWVHDVRKRVLRSTDTIIISGEALHNLPAVAIRGLHELARLVSKTTNLEDGVRILAYVSGPASRFRRVASQSILAGKRIRRPGDHVVKRYVEQYRQRFGRENIEIRTYDKRSLLNGSVIDDFMEFLRPGLGAIAALTKNSIEENRPPSSEALLLCSVLRDLGLNEDACWSTLVTEVILFDRVVSGRRWASLRGSVRDYLAASSPDYDWLREEFGCTFRWAGKRHPSPGYAGDRPLSFPDIFRVDMDRYRELVSYFLKRSVVFGETQARGADLAGKDLISAPCTLD